MSPLLVAFTFTTFFFGVLFFTARYELRHQPH
jgi:hypothetical protein